MKEHIHTIPVLDALRAPDSCPFCVMRQKLERDSLMFMLGSAYMEDDVRMETDRVGFCAAHLEKMYAEQNRLGLGLMLHTYMKRLNKDTDAIIRSRIRPPRFGKANSGPTARLRAHLEAAGASCYLCRMVDNVFTRYMDTFFYLWEGNEEARALIEAVPGYCLPHFTAMLAMAEDTLRAAKLEGFLSVVLPAQQRFMKQVEEDVEWFTLKFDYRNADAPWKNAKDALPRAITMLGEKRNL